MGKFSALSYVCLNLGQVELWSVWCQSDFKLDNIWSSHRDDNLEEDDDEHYESKLISFDDGQYDKLLK